MVRQRRRGRDRTSQLARSIGQGVRLERITLGLSRVEASARAGLARSTWDTIERGAASSTLASLVAATGAVGLDLVCRIYPGRPPGLRDSGQLAIAQALAAIAHPTWRVSFEQRAGDHGEAIDEVFWGPDEIIATEIERYALDWQSQFRRDSLKRDWLAANESRPVRLVVVVLDSKQNRSALSPFAAALKLALPAGTRQVMHAIRTGTPLGSDGLCWFRQPRTS
jgi:transcriptional regulator with XRE-family HTH domain